MNPGLIELTTFWDTWSAEKDLDSTRVRAVMDDMRNAMTTAGLHPTERQWSLFYGLLVWREKGEAAHLIRLLPSVGIKFKPSISVTRFLCQHRPRGPSHREIRAAAYRATPLLWPMNLWHPTAEQFELASSRDFLRWQTCPELAWLFKGRAWGFSPMQGESGLLDTLHRALTVTLAV